MPEINLKSMLRGFCAASSCGAPYLSENFDRATRVAVGGNSPEIEGAAPAPSGRDYTP
ncbi:MAG: hypothetical protein WC043_08810 [Pseudobdellovibrionaceae bacterium]